MKLKIMSQQLVALSLLLLVSASAAAVCRDSVVLVHGNAASPSSWENTVDALLADGYGQQDIFTPDWGLSSCPACNNHNGSEEIPVRTTINNAISQSCTGKIDVIGHSMGVTLAAQQIDKLVASAYVDTFVGIAGAMRGLWSCGVYPYNVWNSACGYYGLSVQSPFLDGLYGIPLGDKVYSIKSYIDQIVCSSGACTLGGIHSSRIWNEDASFTYSLGHCGLQSDTVTKQLSLIQ